MTLKPIKYTHGCWRRRSIRSESRFFRRGLRQELDRHDALEPCREELRAILDDVKNNIPIPFSRLMKLSDKMRDELERRKGL